MKTSELLNESVEGQALRKLDKAIDEAIKTIAKFYESEGDDPIDARQEASNAVFEHLKSGQRA